MKTLLAISALALLVAGCSANGTDPAQTAIRNLMAFNCANGQQIISQVPTMLLTPAQIQLAANAACSTVFGTTAAPIAAPGEGPVFPAPAAK